MEEEEKPKQVKTEQKREDLLEWTVTKIANGINIRGKASVDAFSKRLLAKEENKDAIDSFLRAENPAEVLYVIPQGPDMADVTQTFPVVDKFKKKAIILMNISTQGLKVDKEFFKKNLVVVELTRNIFEHLYQTFNEIMSPVMQNVENQAGWTDLVAKDLMEKFNGYVAQVYVMMGLIKGRTMLPLPSNKLTSSDITPDKDKAHIFEGSIITWTKQIKNVLKQEPEQVLKYGNDPGPLIELEFWQNKADNLNSIHEQLQSVEVKNILRFLEGNKSTYTNPFSKLKSEVQKSRIEANDNNRFLKTLQELFEKLSDPGTDFNTLYELFYPMMHTILLIWQKSRYYNTPPRLVVLIREMCNAIIAKAQSFVDGPLIFSLISDKETTSEACDKLQITIDICSKFKDAYFEYKANAQQQWKLTTNALFVRLDSFLERCHDILHLCNTIKQFNKLERIELGGTKGKSLTESIQQISKEFESAVEGFTQVKYDIMNISQKEFDEDFYQFRSKIKELERRLAFVITQGFDDYDTIYGRFKLLDNFEGLLNRPIIQDELEKKHIVLLDMYKQDLKQVQSIFLEGKILVDKEHENAPLFLNMPPISGALTWCKSLRDRIQEPIEKLTSLGQGITEREEYKDVQKLYASITRSIKDYEESKILNWQKEIEENSEEKLKQSLLTKDENGIVKVNFDPSLIRLLREVKYFKQLELQVPDTAEQIFSKGETYRQQTVSLDMIIQNYNYITTSMHPVEEPLVKKRIQEMEQEIHPGIDDHKWKSSNIDHFISKSKNIVDSLFETVNKMKDSLKKIQGNLSNFNNKIIERKNKPMTPEDYNSYLQAIITNKLSNVKDSGAGIHKLVKEVLDAVKADKKGNQWKNYNDYINCIVIDGIAEAIQTALQHLNDQIDPEYLKKNEHIGPLFDIKLELNSSRIQYEPPIEEDDNQQNTVRNVLKGWMNDFFAIAGTIQRLDNSQPGDYLQEIRAYFEVKQSISQINKNLDDTESECAEYKNKFNKYSIYWEKDPQQEFEKFLNDNVEKDVVKEDEEEEEIGKVNPLLKGCRAKIPPLYMFDDMITQFKVVQSEIEKIPKEQIITWLRIDLKPLKSSLNTKVQQWIKIYTDFLLYQFRTTLKNLQLFIKKTEEGIAKNPAHEQYQGDNELLMKVMKVISDVKDVEPTKKDIVQRLKDMFAKLKKHGALVQEKGQEDPLQVIDNANSEFQEMANMVLTQVKSDIIPMINQETIQIKKRLEQFSEKVKNYRETFLKTLPFHYEERCTMEEIQANYKIIDQYYLKTCEIESEATEYNKLEKLFELQRSQYKQLKECLNDLRNLKIMWDTISMVNYQYNDWKQKPWKQIKAETMLEINKALQNQIKTLPKEIRQYRGYNVIVDKVKNMGTVLPLVSALHSEFMEDRHWDELKKLTARQFDHKSMSFTFEDILSLNLYKYEANVNEIVDVAQKEAKIEKKLKKIETDWNKQIFEFGEYKETKIFLPLDLMMELLDQNSMDLMGMKSQGKFVEYFIHIVENWREKLGRVDVVVNQWLRVQKDWRMLVNIFLASEDIRMQLPEDTKRFEDVDKEFRELMNEVSVNPQVVEACTHERKESLDSWAQKIKICEKSLYDYLEQKKKAFPRFYFLSNQSLLTILSNGQNAPKVCEFLGDCFDGLNGLKFLPVKPGEQFARLGEGMISKDKEFIPFPSHFVCEGAVENWLVSLEFRMKEVLQETLDKSKTASELWDSENPRELWVEEYPAQIALLTTQIVWTEDVYKSFEDLQGGSDSAMRECLKQIQGRIEALINKVRGPLPKLERMKIINIITIDVHGRDVVEKYVIEKIQDPDSFKWLSQLKFVYENKPDSDMHLRQNLRYPWEKDKVRKKCIIRIVDWFRYYTYEYVGNAMRLVVTPLTDRCYITLTQALNLTLGGAPAGPAGTGKTETTKDLGRGVGIFVVVFNCSDQMTKDSMSQIFMGLSQSGAWGCFDEFNRISIEVLSVVATQVKCVLDALKDKQTKFNFVEEGEINLQDSVGFWITMNPGYAGRTELPENLKALFRSCAMVVPDLVLICENMLMSEGFTTAKQLSKKFVALYMLSRELLSKQKHYDWGLRAVKSVLRQAGGLKRADPDISEDPLLKRALRDFNIPKIIFDDRAIFMRLIEDLFPKVDAVTKQDPVFQKVAKDTTKRDMGLVPEDGFVLKVIQLKEIFEVRHCAFLIGPPGCGKTAVWKTLVKCMDNIQEYIEYDTLSPKAVSSDELFGAYSKTKEWKNGVLAVIMKNQVKNEDKYKETQKCKWSVLDGDIDPEWIESLNTVMDDNKVLTLVSNDRIPLSPEMRLLFEISNLKNATPATASRAGVLYVNETDIGWMPFVNQWLERSVEKLFKGTKEGQGIIDSPDIEEVGKFVFYRCFQSYIEGNAEIHDKDKVRYILPMTEMGKVHSICAILDAMLEEHKHKIDHIKNTKSEEDLKTCYEAMFIFAGIWSVGGAIGGGQDDEKDMKDFSAVWKSAAKVKFPEQGTCYDFYWNFDELKWEKWQDKVEAYVNYDDGSNVLNIFSKIFVATAQTTRLKYMIQVHLKRRKPILLIGGAGTGKTAVIKQFLLATDSSKVASKTINFSSFTDSAALQKNIESIVEKKSGRVFGSATNKTLICFIDDLNMPYVDKYTTQSPIQLLMQICTYGSLFNRDQLEERKFLQDLLFFSCMNQKAGSFVVDLRLTRLFTSFTMYTPSAEIIETIFGQITNSHFATISDKVQKMSDPLIKTTIYLFQKILKDTKFSPSAKRFHYQFNFREIAKIVEGLLKTNQKDYKDNIYAIQRVWAHECKRTFEDRFIDEEDNLLFRKYLTESLTKNFGDPDEKNNPLNEPVIFTTFVSEHMGMDPVYIESTGAQLKKVLDDKMEEYNETKPRMQLVLFKQAMEHISKIVRILNMSGNNALLVGVGGSGKQSLTRLSTFIAGFEIDQMIVTSSFTMGDFRNYLSEIYKKISKPSAAPRVFMITDQQIKSETFLVPVNDMLNSGYIFDLFPKEDTDGMIGNIRGEAKGFGIPDNIDAITNFFYDKIRKNMKVVLCHSPVGDAMRIRSRKFPGIINSTSIDWFHPWPKDALIDVSFRFLSEIEFPQDEIRQQVSYNMSDVHLSIDVANKKYLQLERRYNYTTPKSFLELIDFYKKILGEKRSFIDKQIQRYQMGLNILAETQGKVQGLQEELKIKMVKVNQKRQETDELIEKVLKESGIAEQEQTIANEEENKTNAAAAEANAMKEEADTALQEAIPALQRAKTAIDSVNKGNITEMKNLGSPPPGVLLTGRVVLMLMGERVSINDADDKVWKKAQQAMNNPAQFLQKIKEFDGDNIEDNIKDPVDKIIKDPSKKFNQKDMSTQNQAASFLCAWVVNIIEYNRIFKMVKPLREKVQRATEELDTKKKELAIVKERVRILTEKVNLLQKQLDEAQTQKALVEADANACMAKLNAAEKLVNGLAGENKRWRQNVKDLQINIKSVIGDSLLASAFVSYIGAFSARIRLELWKTIWLPSITEKKIPITEGIVPLKVLTTEAIMAQWKNENLPADPMSLENAAVIVSCSRWPLIIDPQLQGQSWIRVRQGENLVIIPMSNSKWLNQLVNAIQMGKAVMIDGLGEEIDATLDPLLSRQIKVKGNNYTLELGGDNIDYDPNFKLFLVTKLVNPHFRPEIAAQCTIINFIVTESGLEEQLLAHVVNIEKNELEMQKQELVKKQNEFSVLLDRLESLLLESLASADPSTILDNQELIENLDKTKKTTTEIQEQSLQAKVTEEEINVQREFYRPVSAEGAMLYFIIITLSVMEHMYQYSLESFYNFFFKAINRTNEKGEERIGKLILNIRYTIYQWISRGLFERHKLTLLTLITFRLMQKKQIEVSYEQAEMEFLIKCTPKIGVENTLDWLPTVAWDAVNGLINLEEFKQFATNLEKDAPNRFKDWYNTQLPEKEKLPLDWKKLDQLPFKKLLVLRCLRPDRITIALGHFIRQVLPDGDGFLDMDSKLSFTDVLESTIADAESATPVFFILSPGADPVKEVEKIGKKNGFERGKSLFIISLGQGQDEIARRKIEEGNREGHWVMLQNIHLMPKWLIELEKILDTFGGEAKGSGNAGFRLFLSADPSKGVPIGILDRSIKLTNEPPSGLKANMKRAWTFFTKEEIEDKDMKIKSILFALCFFHSTLLERKRFGPKGWNMSYPFSMGDLRDSYLVMNRYMEQNQSGKVPLADLVYIFGDIMYGGHIVDDWDRKLCTNYLLNFMTDQLFDEIELFPFIEGKGFSFKVPGQSPYEKYLEHIETQLTQETPLAYGLHPNAEIGFRTAQCYLLFNLLIELQPKEAAGGDEKSEIKSPNDITADMIKYLFEDMDFKNKIFNLDMIKGSIDQDLKGPYQNVFLQEIEYMNNLLLEMLKTLDDIDQGFKGILTISEKMEQIIDSISYNKIPTAWQILAYPSKRGLASWLANLFQRVEQLVLFKDDPITIPKVVMISRFFNPQSFLTAIMQVIGSLQGKELNKLYIQTEIMKKTIEEVDSHSKEGAYVYGFILEGARWDLQGMNLDECKPKEMFSVLPVVLCRAQPIPMEGKEDKGIYKCPAYKTEDRGNTYVFEAQLKTRAPARKWILAGVAIIMDVEGVSDENVGKKEKKA